MSCLPKTAALRNKLVFTLSGKHLQQTTNVIVKKIQKKNDSWVTALGSSEQDGWTKGGRERREEGRKEMSRFSFTHFNCSHWHPLFPPLALLFFQSPRFKPLKDPTFSSTLTSYFIDYCVFLTLDTTLLENPFSCQKYFLMYLLKWHLLCELFLKYHYHKKLVIPLI